LPEAGGQSPPLPDVQDDIDGRPRSAPHDVGADQFESGTR